MQLGQVAEDAASNGVCYPEFVETGKKSASSEIKTSTRTGIRMFCNGAGEAFVDVMLAPPVCPHAYDSNKRGARVSASPLYACSSE